MKDMTMTWKEEIRVLGSDFLIDKRTVEAIIRTVSARGLSGDVAYMAAWRRLFPLM